jgi:hypothetical protein
MPVVRRDVLLDLLSIRHETEIAILVPVGAEQRRLIITGIEDLDQLDLCLLRTEPLTLNNGGYGDGYPGRHER